MANIILQTGEMTKCNLCNPRAVTSFISQLRHSLARTAVSGDIFWHRNVLVVNWTYSRLRVTSQGLSASRVPCHIINKHALKNLQFPNMYQETSKPPGDGQCTSLYAVQTEAFISHRSKSKSCTSVKYTVSTSIDS